MKQLTREEAIALAKTNWWKGRDAYQVAMFQMQQDCLCMNFGDFQEAVTQALGRSVFTHEFARRDLLLSELRGNTEPPSFEEIFELIPPKKLIVVVDDNED